jgi:hypothetical protein
MEELSDERFELIGLRTRLAAPSPEATTKNQHGFMYLSRPGFPADRDAVAYRFITFTAPGDTEREVIIDITGTAHAMVSAIGGRRGHDERAYCIFFAMCAAKDAIDTGQRDRATIRIDSRDVEDVLHRLPAPDVGIREYVARRLHRAYQAAGRQAAVRFSWCDWEYLGVDAHAFNRAIDLRRGVDWQDTDNGLAATTILLERMDSDTAAASHASPRQTGRPDGTGSYDLFISYASEDLDNPVRPLVEALRQAGLSVWFAETQLVLGSKLRQEIERGLASSRFGLVVVSESFFQKQWPQRELDALFSLEADESRILPVWHDVGKEEVARASPILAGRLAVSTSQGLPKVVEEVLRAVRRAEKFNQNVVARPAEEIEILSHALRAGGELYLLRSEQAGEWIRVGESNFDHPTDPRRRKAVLAAFRRLVEAGIVEHEAGVLYSLTAAGVVEAEKLVQSR